MVNEFKSTQPVDVNFLIAFFMFAFCIFLDKVIVIKVYIKNSYTRGLEYAVATTSKRFFSALLVAFVCKKFLEHIYIIQVTLLFNK